MLYFYLFIHFSLNYVVLYPSNANMTLYVLKMHVAALHFWL